MTESARRRRAGRRGGDSDTRTAILDAARREFGEHGYDAATIRGIAAVAEVNPALVHHFYGTKEQLFAAAMRIPVVPSEVIKALAPDSPDHLGEALVRTLLTAWEVADVREAFLGLVRSAATSEQGAAMLREFVTGTILAAVAQMAGGPDEAGRRYRASLAASQVVGLAFTRYLLRLEPIASASADDLVAAIGPVIQRYLTGELAG
ncbi:MAG TPA: TetR family transcriptional regulator [Streptosporangiaceae bacterium]|nr:TetR family transcriptional regulator [Streptosporangiaceae bacterium]